MLASLNNFTARQEEEKLEKKDTEPVKVMGFYQTMMRSYYWHSKLLQKKRGEGGQEEDSDSESSDKADLEMAGRRYAVCSQQVSVEETYPGEVQRYLYRAHSPHGYHNDHKVDATVF